MMKPENKEMAEKIILDTDLGTDCDDAGAIAMLINMASEGKAEILGMTHCASELSGVIAVKAICDWYGAENMPIGRLTRYSFLEGEKYQRFTGEVSREYEKVNGTPEFEDSVKLMRRLLAENSGVTLVTIGMLNNIADLLKSEPDEISSKSGKELVESSVKCLYSMGGNFVDKNYCEYNIKADAQSAIYVAENFPAPIVYAGFELGCEIKTGINLKNVPENHPVRRIYDVIGGLGMSWDLIATYCAAEQDNKLFRKSTGQTITFDGHGKTIVKEGGKDYYLIAYVSEEEIRQELDRYVK